MFNILDLFCGAGGFSYGMHKNQYFKTKVALDINYNNAQSFSLNMPETKLVIGDIRDNEIKKDIIKSSIEQKVNMIIGGPPCQGFSLKGKKLGLEDPRNFLFLEFLDIVNKIKPDVFVIENVKSLATTANGWFKNQIIEEIEKLGYYINFNVLNAKFYNVPQNRERVFIICSKNKLINLISEENKIISVKDAISDLSYLNSNEGSFEQEYLLQPMSKYQELMRKNSQKLYNHKSSNHSEIAIQKLKLILPEKGKECLPKELLGKQKYSSTWGRLKWDLVSPTIDTRFDACSNGTNIHPYLNRSITPREAARLQSFDDNFIFYGNKVAIRTQIGNAVPPLLSKYIADCIYDNFSK